MAHNERSGDEKADLQHDQQICSNTSCTSYSWERCQWPHCSPCTHHVQWNNPSPISESIYKISHMVPMGLMKHISFYWESAFQLSFLCKETRIQVKQEYDKTWHLVIQKAACLTNLGPPAYLDSLFLMLLISLHHSVFLLPMSFFLCKFLLHQSFLSAHTSIQCLHGQWKKLYLLTSRHHTSSHGRKMTNGFQPEYIPMQQFLQNF